MDEEHNVEQSSGNPVNTVAVCLSCQYETRLYLICRG